MRLIVLVAIVVAIPVAVILTIRSKPKNVIERKQAALVTALEKRKGGRLKRLMAESYRDQWDFNRDDAVISMLDVGSQFFILTVLPEDPSLEIGDGRATVKTGFQVSGSGSPIAQEVIRRANRLREPFVFTWTKQSFWPGSWRLAGIENADLPDELYGYEPGDIGRRISSGGGF